MAAIALAELAVMLLLPLVAPHVSEVVRALLDATMLTVLAAPVILWRVRAEVRRMHGSSEPMAPMTQWRMALVSIAVLVGGLAATAAVVIDARNAVQDRARARFEQLADRLIGDASRRVNQTRYGLAGARGTLLASTGPDFSRTHVKRYVASRDLATEFPGTLGFGIIRHVKRTGVAAFESAEQADGAPTFKVWSLPAPGSPSPSAPDLYVITSCFPEVPNARAWGLDVGSEPTRRAAVERAAFTGEPSITAKISLVQDGKQRTGFLYFLPVYRPGPLPITREAREAALVALVYAPIILDEALGDLATAAGADIDFEIFDGTEANAGSILFDYDRHLSAVTGRVDDSYFVDRRFTKRTVVRVGGRDWTFTTSSTPAFEAQIDNSTPVTIATAGMMTSILAAAFAFALITGRSRAMALASDMTKDLLAAKADADRLAEIARRTSNAVVITDAAGRIEWVNAGFTRITGYEFEEVIGKKPGTLLQGPATDATMVARLRDAVRNGSVANAELVNYGKHGRAYRLAIELTPLRNATGQPTGFMAIESDITEQYEAQQTVVRTNAELRAAHEAADAANRAKSAFLANMSHEIRTPLTAILGFADILREDVDSTTSAANRRNAIDTIRDAGSHLLAIINDILDLSKIEAEQVTLERIDTSVTKVLRDVATLMRPRAISKGVALEVALTTPVPDPIRSDPTRLRQILMNLVGNAVKFTDSGHVRITAGVVASGDRSQLCVDIEDTGPGIDPTHVGRLFKPFGQADETVSRKHGGTGLGLMICRRLAALMGGDVTLHRTSPGEGSCFRLTMALERTPSSVEVMTLDVGRASSVASTRAPSLTGRVLLAEDGADNQRLISFHLKKAGAEVDIADNGLIALRLIEESERNGTPYDLLLTDMQMPELDGYALVTRLRSQGSTLAVVALTANAMTEDRARCAAAGCDDYATKPIDKAALIATCAAWMGKTGGAPAT